MPKKKNKVKHKCQVKTHVACNDDDAKYDRRRLDWLVWWTRWALDNCKHPTFYNS